MSMSTGMSVECECECEYGYGYGYRYGYESEYKYDLRHLLRRVALAERGRAGRRCPCLLALSNGVEVDGDGVGDTQLVSPRVPLSNRGSAVIDLRQLWAACSVGARVRGRCG